MYAHFLPDMEMAPLKYFSINTATAVAISALSIVDFNAVDVFYTYTWGEEDLMLDVQRMAPEIIFRQNI